jgi:hypothetical protein
MDKSVRFSYWHGFVICCLIGFSISCGRPNEQALLQTLFDGFEYAGVEGSANDPTLEAKLNGKLPTNIESGKKYVFYLPVASLSIGNPTNIKERLERIGAKIISGPTKVDDERMLHIYIGGPLFNFKFKYGTRFGVVGNQVEPKIRGDNRLLSIWSTESYYLQMLDGVQ